jgi:hypothetical protein
MLGNKRIAVDHQDLVCEFTRARSRARQLVGESIAFRSLFVVQIFPSDAHLKKAMGSSANFKEACDALDASSLNDMQEEIGCETYVGLVEFRRMVHLWTQATFPLYKDAKAMDTLSERYDLCYRWIDVHYFVRWWAVFFTVRSFLKYCFLRRFLTLYCGFIWPSFRPSCLTLSLFQLLDVSCSYTLNLNLLQETLADVLARNDHVPLFGSTGQV